ncbi:CAF17-like 4Fe-4S cluster assembly/insertion protein YgfZ [Cellvibrio sp. OA-2007]|uniref:CAF17-like 4Fe-4S cluster assembly/insertion protein YgfZ n=1 Tax=Cellvibrio sp. OA-2007 TaxID=529823 RepID=UPI000781435F|nr:folate-binding protein YgfZ [Cellvibrio sp. OA-2007]
MTHASLTTNHSTYRVTLNQTRLLLVKGPDASKFLQGQVTCDLRELSAPVTRIGAQCNPKGRILLSFRALQMDAETIALRIPASMLEKAKSSLGKYIVFSKAKLHDDSDYSLYGIYGDAAQQTVEAVFKKLPAGNDGWIEQDGNFLIQLDEHRFECWIKSSEVAKFEQLTSHTLSGDINGWELQNIRAGVADIHPETLELFTPQEINYQLINGINFRKGCYTGQEIVARLHYRGKLKRHMYRFTLSSTQLPTPGSALINAKTRQACGHLVAAAFAADGQIEILASLLDEQLDQVTLENSGEIFSQLPLPYAIPTADDIIE